MFSRLETAGELLGVADALPDGRFRARLDPRGNLLIEPDDVATVVAELRRGLSDRRAAEMEARQRSRSAALIRTTEASAAIDEPDEPSTRARIADLGERIADLLPYGVLAKFVPDALLASLRLSGDLRPPPVPWPSAGGELSVALDRLARKCLARGYPPDRLQSEWPEVDPPTAGMVRGFCRDHAGFGPLAWEAPGFEDPRYVFRAMRAMGPPAERMEAPRRRGSPTGAGAAGAAGTRGLLAFWLDFLERETWYVRRAFHRGMAPLLRGLAALVRERGLAVRPATLLFCELRELERPLDSSVADAARARRRAYMRDAEYRSRHGVIRGRLEATVHPDW